MKAMSVGLLAVFVATAAASAASQVLRDPTPAQQPNRDSSMTTTQPAERTGINNPSVMLTGQSYVAKNDLRHNQPRPHRDRDDFLRANETNLTQRDLQAIVSQRQVLNERGVGPLRDDTGRPISAGGLAPRSANASLAN